jgi:hypothetical protein
VFDPFPTQAVRSLSLMIEYERSPNVKDIKRKERKSFKWRRERDNCFLTNEWITVNPKGHRTWKISWLNKLKFKFTCFNRVSQPAQFWMEFFSFLTETSAYTHQNIFEIVGDLVLPILRKISFCENTLFF